MHRTALTASFCILFALLLPAQKPDYRAAVSQYLVKYGEIAVREMKISGIPASITLAQGILESNAGQSALAREANNHFGIKCHKEWKGATYFQDDDKPNECFRKYDEPGESFRDHSSFLVTRDRYRPLFKLDPTDYKAWAAGLKKAGYATNPAYADQLVRTIEKYMLYRFDTGDFGVAYTDSLGRGVAVYLDNPWLARFQFVRVTSDNHRIFRNNGLLLTIAVKGDDLESLASSFGLSPRKLRKYNDLGENAIRPGQIVYLESKKRKAVTEIHRTRDGETLWEISQGYGIRLGLIYRRNDIRKGTEPGPGRLLRLR